MRSAQAPPLTSSDAEIAAGQQTFPGKTLRGLPHHSRHMPRPAPPGPTSPMSASRQYIAAGLLRDDARLARGLDRRSANAQARQQHADGAAHAGRAALGLRLSGEPEMTAAPQQPDTRDSDLDRPALDAALVGHLEDARRASGARSQPSITRSSAAATSSRPLCSWLLAAFSPR